MPWLVAAAIPRQQRYVLHVLIFTALFAALALSYDLVVGHVGSLSLAHPAFFGIGAYAAAILATRAGWPFLAERRSPRCSPPPWWPRWSACRCSGSPSTRSPSARSASALVASDRGHQLGGGHARAALHHRHPEAQASARWRSRRCPPSTGWRSTALVAVALLYRGLTTFRLGRAFHAVRDNEPLAGAAGINPLKYRLLAFTLAGAIAGGIGALYAHYLSVMCPEEMTVSLTVNLLVIVFLGGVGSLRGVLVGAVLFTALPEVLRLAPTWRLVIYGALLLLVVIRSPGGLESLLRRRARSPR